MPAGAASGRGRRFLFPLVGAAVVIAVGTAAYISTRALRDPAQNDAIIVGLLTTPLPPSSYDGWRLTTKPYLTEARDAEPGEIGDVHAYLDQGSRIGAFSFTVFQTPAQAQLIFDERTTLGPDVGPDIAGLQQQLTTRGGAPVWCLGGGLCHAAVGRVIVFVRMEGSTVATNSAIVDSLAGHVSQFDR